MRTCSRRLGSANRDRGRIEFPIVFSNLLKNHYWHSNYWDPLYTVHEDLNVTWGFHEGISAYYSHMIDLYGENRFYRHVASHWIEMQ